MATRASERNEVKICGVNACRALFQRRPGDVLRVFLTAALVQSFGPALRACARARRPYRVVRGEELERIAASRHHEGICVVARAPAARSLAEILRAPGPAVILALAGVGNPHNVGALVRTAAHFGARAALVAGPGKRLPAAAYRTAEGAAEWLDIAFPGDMARACAAARRDGFAVCATSSREGESLFERRLPTRALLLMGAERDGLPASLMAVADRLLRIPGTGRVDSLNVASATAVILAEMWRQRSAAAQ